MPAFSLVNRPPLPSGAASPGTRRSPTQPSGRWPSCWIDTTSAVRLSPATLSARNHLTSELLRTLSRVAASKPTSWLSLRLHILFYLVHASVPYPLIWSVSLSSSNLIALCLSAPLFLTGLRIVVAVSNLVGPL